MLVQAMIPADHEHGNPFAESDTVTSELIDPRGTTLAAFSVVPTSNE